MEWNVNGNRTKKVNNGAAIRQIEKVLALVRQSSTLTNIAMKW